MIKFITGKNGVSKSIFLKGIHDKWKEESILIETNQKNRRYDVRH